MTAPAPATTQHSDDAAALNLLGAKLGSTMMAMLIDAHGHEAAALFATAITTPTLPGTPNRAAQDRAWSLLTSHLSKLGGEAV